MARWRHAVARLACAASTLCLAGCATYLHDPDLQKSTAGALATYKSTDLLGAMNAAIDQQQRLDEAEVQGMAEAEATYRERAMADLLWPAAGAGDAISRLQARAQGRLVDLGVASAPTSTWIAYGERAWNLEAEQQAADAQLAVDLAAYNRTLSKERKDCKGLPLLSDQPSQVEKNLGDDCASQGRLTEKRALLRQPVKVATGEIGALELGIKAIDDRVDAIATEKAASKVTLKAAKDQVDALGKKPTADKQVQDALKELNDVIQDADKASGLAGHGELKLGKALALVEFRQANLRDALKPSAATDDTPSGSAGRAIAGLIAGVISLRDANSGAPSAASLSIALAAQQGLQSSLQLQLDGLKMQKALLVRQESALLTEVEMLAAAKVAADTAVAELAAKAAAAKTPADVATAAKAAEACRAPGLRDAMIAKECPAEVGRQLSRGLAAYNISWAAGRAPARVAELRQTHQIAMTDLLVSREALKTRVDVQTTALNTLAAYGEGGITPATIAAFLQSLGVVGIAVGEN